MCNKEYALILLNNNCFLCSYGILKYKVIILFNIFTLKK